MLRALIIALTISASQTASAYDLDLEGFSKGNWINLDEMYIEWRKYESYRNAYLPDEKQWNFRGEFHNRMSMYERLYWDTNLHMSMDESQIRYVGLEYYVGFKWFPWLHAIKYH